MRKGQKLLMDTLIYMVANFGAKILLLLVYPAYTYLITPSDLGVYDLIVSTLSLIYPILVFSINDAVFRWLLDNTESKQYEIISAGLKITFRNLIVFNAFYVVVNLIFRIKYGWLILAIINLGSIYPVLQQIARGLSKNKVFAISGLLYAIALVLFNCIFLIGLKLGIEGLLLSQALAYLVACIFLFLSVDKLCSSWWHIKASDDILKGMTKYSLMLIPNSCCWWIMNASDRYLIRIFIGNAANGIYSISHKFPSVLNMVTSVFSLAWQEQAIAEYSNSERDLYYSEIYRFYYIFLFNICLLLQPLTKWFVLTCIQNDYASSWQYSSALYLGSVFLALACFLGTGYLSAKNTQGSMITSMAGAVINLIVDLILLPVIGLEAAAIATLLGNIGIWAARWIQTKKYFTIHVHWSEFWLLTTFNVVIGIIIRNTNYVEDLLILFAAGVFVIISNRDIIKRSIAVIKQKMLQK